MYSENEVTQDTRDFISASSDARSTARDLAQRLSSVGLSKVAEMCWQLMGDIERMSSTHQETESKYMSELLRSSQSTLPLTFMGVMAGMAIKSDNEEEARQLLDIGNSVGGSIPPMELPEEPAASDFVAGANEGEGLE